MSPSKVKDYNTGKFDPLAGDPVVAAFQRTYGAGVQAADILTIKPDMAQPRRVIPLSIRGQWDGDPIELAGVLSNWHLIVEERIGVPIHLPDFLTGKGDGLELKSDDPVVDAYFAVIGLAASIFRDGLEQPVALVQRGDVWQIIWGERRWVAYHLLNLHVSGDYMKIPAVVKDKIDVWAQAAENGARQPLNAIGMARQIALLIMDMYATGKDVPFDRIEKLVLPGEPDRKFYAQVANGNVYRIPKGQTQRVMDVTGLKTPERVRNFRALLDIPDGLWIKADEQNWTEWQIRDYVGGTEKTRSEAVTPLDTVAVATVSGGNQGSAEGESEDSAFQVGDFVKTKDGHVGKILSLSKSGSSAWIEGDRDHFGGRATAGLVKVDAPEKTPSTNQLTPAEATLLRHPVGSAVYHFALRKIGIVKAYQDDTNELIVADPTQTDTQPLMGWKVSQIRAATEDEYPQKLKGAGFAHGFKVDDEVRIQGSTIIGKITTVMANQVCVKRPNPSSPGSFMTHWVIPERVHKVSDEPAITGGLYDQPATPPRTPTYDEDEDWSDDDAEDDEGEALDGASHEARGKTGVSVAAASVRETTTAILAAWENPDVERILKFLRVLAGEDKALKLAVDELMTISRADVVRYIDTSVAQLNFDDWLRNEQKRLNTLIYERLDVVVSAFLNHLYEIGQEIKAQERE